MPIVYETVPPDSLDALDAGQALLAQGEVNLRAMLERARGNTAAHQPHRMLSLPAQHLDKPQLQQFFVPTGWRYIGNLDGVDYSVEVGCDAAEQQHAFAMINFGPYIAATRAGLAAAGQHPDISAQPYHFALLHVPAVPLLALYFYTDTDAPPFAMVLSPLSVDPSRSQQLLPIAEFLTVLEKERGKAS